MIFRTRLPQVLARGARCYSTRRPTTPKRPALDPKARMEALEGLGIVAHPRLVRDPKHLRFRNFRERYSQSFSPGEKLDATTAKPEDFVTIRGML